MACQVSGGGLAFGSMTSPTINEPVLPEATMHACRPNEPATAVVTKNELCTAGRKAAGFVRHVEIDVSGTPLEGVCRSGQAIGIIPPGEDERGRPHKLRLYSLACPTGGEDGAGKILSTTVKRTIDEHWDNHRLFCGVASNYLCDVQEGDQVLVTGPNGKRFLLPEDPHQHEYRPLDLGGRQRQTLRPDRNPSHLLSRPGSRALRLGVDVPRGVGLASVYERPPKELTGLSPAGAQALRRQLRIHPD